MTEKFNEYEAAQAVEIGRAQGIILGEKPLDMIDTVVGDPDTFHKPQAFAEYEE
jgi:hypothetical protein